MVVREQAEKARLARAAQAAAQSIMNKPVTLQFRDANLRMVFEALSRTTGLNVILDRDVRADLKTTIFVKDAAVEDTVDLILLQNQLEKRALNANTLFIYPATAAKQKEYQDLQVRTFQVTNIDVKYLQTLLKNVLKVKDISVDERSGTLVMRDTADAIAVASKVIAAHDVPEPEVMLEVEVLEISHDRLQNLGIQFPNSLTVSTPESATTVGAFKALTRNDLLVSSLSLGVNLKLEDSDSNILASPRIRARNKEKARILIGDRVPIITNSVTPMSTGAGVVTGSVTYQDVGLKLEFEPQIYSDQEVGIRIALEVSNIAKEIPGPSGSLAYQIGTRNASTVVRLRDGETQILAGLIAAEDRNASARIPGLGHLPMVGKLFGNNSGNNKKTEIVLSITPRIVRPPAILDAVGAHRVLGHRKQHSRTRLATRPGRRGTRPVHRRACRAGRWASRGDAARHAGVQPRPAAAGTPADARTLPTNRATPPANAGDAARCRPRAGSADRRRPGDRRRRPRPRSPKNRSRRSEERDNAFRPRVASRSSSWSSRWPSRACSRWSPCRCTKSRRRGSRRPSCARHCRTIRAGLDTYKAATDSGALAKSAGESGYPPSLDVLTQVLEMASKRDFGLNASAASQRMVILRQLPRDPFYPDPQVPAAQTWNTRAYASRRRRPATGRRRVRRVVDVQPRRARRHPLQHLVARTMHAHLQHPPSHPLTTAPRLRARIHADRNAGRDDPHCAAADAGRAALLLGARQRAAERAAAERGDHPRRDRQVLRRPGQVP